MSSALQIFSLFTIALVVFTRISVKGAPVENNFQDDLDFRFNLPKEIHSAHAHQSKRNLQMEGILIGKREFPADGILLGKRNYPIEGIMLGKREFPTDGILLGKRDYPTEGVLLGRRNSAYQSAQNLLKQHQ